MRWNCRNVFECENCVNRMHLWLRIWKIKTKTKWNKYVKHWSEDPIIYKNISIPFVWWFIDPFPSAVIVKTFSKLESQWLYYSWKLISLHHIKCCQRRKSNFQSNQPTGNLFNVIILFCSFDSSIWKKKDGFLKCFTKFLNRSSIFSIRHYSSCVCVCVCGVF